MQWPGLVMLAGVLSLTGCGNVAPGMKHSRASYSLDYHTPVDAPLQARLASLDARLRERHGMGTEHTAVGVLDLRDFRLALLRPDLEFYAASVPKIAILLAWFARHPAAARNLDASTRRELGEMIKLSSNEMASKFSRELGLREIQLVLDEHGFYDAQHGGGLWMGKHYGQGGERVGSPVANNSHAATARQLLRFYLLLEQGRLVSPEASQAMRDIFASPEIPHRPDKFVLGLAGRDVVVLRKAGWWEDWFHDTAIVHGPGRHYVIVALTHHPQGDAYLVEFARAVDDLMAGAGR